MTHGASRTFASRWNAAHYMTMFLDDLRDAFWSAIPVTAVAMATAAVVYILMGAVR